LGSMQQMQNTFTNAEMVLDPGMLKPQKNGKFFKTKVCKFYVAGMCTRGQQCVYSHSTAETRNLPDLYKTELCASFSYHGWCSKGGACRFAHGSSELRITSTSPKQIPTTHKALPDAPRISFSKQRQDVAVLPNVAMSIHEPHVQTGCRHVRAPKSGLAPATCKLHAPKANFLRQCWNPTFLEAQKCSFEGPLSSHMCVAAVGGCRRNHEEKKEENCQSQKDIRTISGFDDHARSSAEVDGVRPSSPEDWNEHVAVWDRQTTVEGSWTIPTLSSQSSSFSESEQDAQAEPKKPQAAELHLIVVNTFLELRSVGSAATRSKSAGGRIESASV